MKQIALAIILVALSGCEKEPPMTKETPPCQESPGVGLRYLALSTAPDELGFQSDSEFPTVYGVLTDWDIDGKIVTVMSMRDGTTSLYTTSTFGIIGGQGQTAVRQAAAHYVKTAEQFATSGKPTNEFTYPKSGQVFYYILTYDGVRLITGNETAIEQGSDPTYPLFAAAQNVLTELLVDEQKNSQSEAK